MTFILGLTGGIGSGKSTVARLFSSLGAQVVDTDDIAHALTRPGGAALPAICAEFGAESLQEDGGMNRARMRQLVFSDASAKARLEALLHPMIRAECERYRRQTDAPYLIFVIPLLIETGFLRHEIDRMLLVDCDEETQKRRVMARNGLSYGEVCAIMEKQTSRETRQMAADDIILNEGTLDCLSQEAARLHRNYLCLARQKDPPPPEMKG